MQLISSFYTQFFAHAVVVIKHVLERAQIELMVIHRVLAERDARVFVNDSANLCDCSWTELAVGLVPDDLHFFACI